jgi:hypothetical protein
MTRTECLRRRAEPGIPENRQKAREAEGLVETDESTRRLVHALMVLGGQQREILDLSLRHEPDPHELAEILNMTPQNASVLLEQARNDLNDAFAAVVVAATGRDDCPDVPAAAGPEGRPGHRYLRQAGMPHRNFTIMVADEAMIASPRRADPRAAQRAAPPRHALSRGLASWGSGG